VVALDDGTPRHVYWSAEADANPTNWVFRDELRSHCRDLFEHARCAALTIYIHAHEFDKLGGLPVADPELQFRPADLNSEIHVRQS
jgi:hypothetical protein